MLNWVGYGLKLWLDPDRLQTHYTIGPQLNNINNLGALFCTGVLVQVKARGLHARKHGWGIR